MKRLEQVLATLRATKPENREQLRHWVELFCGLHMPATACCAHHQSPLDYLAHAFFEGDGERAPDCVVWACRGGGKTMLGAVATLLDVVFRPGIDVRILGGSFEQSEKMYGYLTALTRRGFSDWLAETPTQRTMRFKNGSRVVVLPQSDRAVRSMRVQRVRCDEVELFDPEIWSAVQLTTRSSGNARAGVEALSTLHVPGGLMEQTLAAWRKRGKKTFSWCVWDVIEKCPPQRECSSCPLFDACAGRAKQADGFLKIDDVIAMRERVSEQTWRHEMLCEAPRRSDAVFADFDMAKHVRPWVEGEHRVERFVGGVDFGFSKAFVCLWLARTTRADGATCFYVIDELVLKHTRLEAAAKQIAARRPEQLHALHCDNAGRAVNSQTHRSDLQVLREMGFAVQSRSGSIVAGCETIAALLAPAAGEPRLFIDPRCERLITAMRSYHVNAHGEPEKDGTHDHLVDALRYAITGELRPSEKVVVRFY